jgi:PTS system N-acetylgalactosamine-specific IIA component
MNSGPASAGQEPAGPPRAVVIGHGDFAGGMLSAVANITGRAGVLVAVSGQHLSLIQLERQIRDLVIVQGITVIFSDLLTGSGTMAARRVLRDAPGAVLIAGANLPMLLDFVLNTSSATPGDAALHAADRGRAAIAVQGGPE